MNAILIQVFTLVCLFTSLKCEEKNPYLEALQRKSWESVQKYIEVRPGVFLFYWLYYADGVKYGSDLKPLIIWIQGGPGYAATGIANFAEIGPLTIDMQPRNHTWVNGRSVLLIDHPVGSGFSYAVNETLLVKTDKDADKKKTVCFAGLKVSFVSHRDASSIACIPETNKGYSLIARDLLRAIKKFYNIHKEFRKTPTYLFGQSYGSKLCPRLGYYLHRAIKKNLLKMNFKGLGIGSGWVSPKLSTLAQPEFLYNMGIIDLPTYTKTMKLAKDIGLMIDKKDYFTARKLNDMLFQVVIDEAEMEINFNNLNQPTVYSALKDLTENVNRYVKPTIAEVRQSLTWTCLSEKAFQSLEESFLVPSNKFLETLLNHTELKIAVYNGNLDVVTPLAGATNWVHALKWHGAQEFTSAKRIPIRGHKNGFYKAAKQFSFWTVFGSGHWIPEDNPTAMEQILDYVIEDSNLVHPE